MLSFCFVSRRFLWYKRNLVPNQSWRNSLMEFRGSRRSLHKLLALEFGHQHSLPYEKKTAVQIKCWFGFFICWILSFCRQHKHEENWTRKVTEIKCPKSPVRQVSSSSTIFLTWHQNILCMDDACSWTSKKWKVVETVPSKSLKNLNSGSLAPCSQEERPPELQYSFVCPLQNSSLIFSTYYLNLQTGEEQSKKVKLKDMSSLMVLIHDCNCYIRTRSQNSLQALNQHWPLSLQITAGTEWLSKQAFMIKRLQHIINIYMAH